jgi:predicted nucleic acid-binding protein
MHVLGRDLGFHGQRALWDFLDQGFVAIHIPDGREIVRIAELMKIYQNVPMDLADASLIAAGESLRVQQVFTLDSDFLIIGSRTARRHW